MLILSKQNNEEHDSAKFYLKGKIKNRTLKIGDKTWCSLFSIGKQPLAF